jgi:NADPH:quinone reductase-like Zn-dependent oxidoreductase
MRALELGDVGLAHLRLVERAAPRPGRNEILLGMRAAAVGLRDYKVVTGAYANGGQRYPLVPGGEGVGEVLEVGDDVAGVRVGDRVNPLFVQEWLHGRPRDDAVARTTLGGPLRDGSFAELMVVPARSVVRVPAHLTDVEAATLPFAGLTAWSAVAEHGGVRAGDTVVIQGTGGVALFALQFAKLLGATAIVTSKNDEKLRRAVVLGADHVINYRAVPEWSRRVLDITEGSGADLVLDPGGTVTMSQSVRAVRAGGAIGVIGALGAAEIGISLPHLLGRNLRVQGANAGSREAHVAMARAIAASGMRPVLERVVPLEAGVEAVAAMPASEQFGKVCIQF